MENLLDRWKENRELFIEPIFLMFDFDGTLTPIVKRPDDAGLSKSVRGKLSHLADFCPVAVISGRSLEDLKARVGLDRIYYSGNHGYEIEGRDIDFVKEEASNARNAIENILEGVRRRINFTDRVIFEDKGYTAVVHYRLVGDESEIEKIEQIVKEEASPYNDQVELSHGKKIFEFGPNLDWDKGKAVSFLISSVPLEEDTMPIYFGDDITDEYAFNTLKDEGLGVLVSEERRESAADFRLNDVDEVEELLGNLLDLY